MSNNDMNSKDFLLGAIVGGILGAAAALLLAPKSGRELRSDLSEKSQVAVSKAKEAVGSITSELKEWRESRKFGQDQVETASVDEPPAN